MFSKTLHRTRSNCWDVHWSLFNVWLHDRIPQGLFMQHLALKTLVLHGDVMTWKRFAHYWPFHRWSTGDRWILVSKNIVSLNKLCTNCGVASDLRRLKAHVTSLSCFLRCSLKQSCAKIVHLTDEFINVASHIRSPYSEIYVYAGA